MRLVSQGGTATTTYLWARGRGSRERGRAELGLGHGRRIAGCIAVSSQVAPPQPGQHAHLAP